jgi:hypothetical protein
MALPYNPPFSDGNACKQRLRQPEGGEEVFSERASPPLRQAQGRPETPLAQLLSMEAELYYRCLRAASRTACRLRISAIS